MKNGNGRMVQYEEYVAGWLDSKISDFVELLRPVPVNLNYALITCLDSNLDLPSLLTKSPELRPIAKSAQVVGDAILLPTDLILDTHANSPFFFGFDEVWFFPTDDIDPKPGNAWLVGPKRVNQPQLRKLGRWLTDNNCSLGLGDGDGLNIVVKAGGLAKHLIGHSLSQPQHSLIAEVD